MKKALCTFGFLSLVLCGQAAQPSSYRFPFDNFPNTFWSAFDEKETSFPKGSTSVQKDKLVLTYEIPGFSKEDVSVAVEENNILSIRVKKKTSTKDIKKESTSSHYSERSFSRSFTLPREAAAKKVSAVVKDGILTIEIPLKEKISTSTHRVEVK